MLSEVDSWVREDSDQPEADLGLPVHDGASIARTKLPKGGAVDLDDFLGDYEQPQAHLLPAEEIPSFPQDFLRQNGTAGSRDNWPLLAHATACTSSTSMPTKATVEPSAGGTRGPMGSLGAKCGANFRDSDSPVGSDGRGPGRLTLLEHLGIFWHDKALGGRLSAAGFRGACREAYYSRVMAYLYLGVLALNMWILIKCIMLSPIDAPLVLAESFVTLMLILEVSLRAVVMVRLSLSLFLVQAPRSIVHSM